jgi:hypothetical protein
MTLPAVIFGFFAATLYGGVMHLWKDGGMGKLLLYLVLSWIGFFIGQITASKLGWSIVDIGPLHFGIASLGSILLLGFGHWLSLIQVEKHSTGT